MFSVWIWDLQAVIWQYHTCTMLLGLTFWVFLCFCIHLSDKQPVSCSLLKKRVCGCTIVHPQTPIFCIKTTWLYSNYDDKNDGSYIKRGQSLHLWIFYKNLFEKIKFDVLQAIQWQKIIKINHFWPVFEFCNRCEKMLKAI